MSARIPPIIQAAISGVLGWSLSTISPFLAFTSAWRFLPVCILITAGAAILVVAIGAFVRAKTTVNPLVPEQAETLVTSGLYLISRNPMYLAMALALTGGALLLGNLAAFFGPTLFVGLITQFQIKPEERALLTKFGAAYQDYRRRTRRWL